MALDQSALLELLDELKAADVGDRVRQAADTTYQALIEAELTAVIGAAPHERIADRAAQRSGHRARTPASASPRCRGSAPIWAAEVGAFRDRSLAGHAFPYVFLNATYCKARMNRRMVSQAVVIATGVLADGWREVLEFAVGDSEDRAFWTEFLRSLMARGLGGVQLVIFDAHIGLSTPSPRCYSARPGNAAACISCASRPGPQGLR